MSVRGAWGRRGLWSARAPPRGGRLLSILIIALLALPLLPLANPTAHAQSATDPWFGPSDRASPTSGWAVRVPVVVQNPLTCAGCSISNVPVAVDVDFGALLVQAGWTNRTAGTDVGLRNFTLDLDSIRVIEYGPGFAPGPKDGSRAQPVPSTFYRAPFHAAKHKDFDPARNPAGTVLFYVKGTMAPQERRYYYIYANPLEYGTTPPAQYALADRAPLDAYLWGSGGTTVYGYEPQQEGTGHLVHVMAMFAQTHVEVSTYALGRFTLVPSTQTSPNPTDLGAAFCFPQPECYQQDYYVPSGSAFRVAADKPVVVMATGNTDQNQTEPNGGGINGIIDGDGYIPATNGSYKGHDFFVYGYRTCQSGCSYLANKAGVTVLRASTGTVTVDVCCNKNGGNYNANSVTLSLTNSRSTLYVPQGQWSRITATGGDIMVTQTDFPLSTEKPFQTVSVPALTGGPEGDDFLVAMPQDGGFVRICPVTDVSLFMIDTGRPSLAVLPVNGNVADASTALKLSPATGCYEYNATVATPTANLLEIYSVKGDAGKPGLFTVTQGAGERSQATPPITRGMVGAYGGPGSNDYWVHGQVGAFGYFNDTRVSVQVEKDHDGARSITNASPFAVSEGGFQVVDPSRYQDATGLLHITSDKPIGLVALDQADHQYAHFVPGRPLNLTATLGAAEFRGPLVDLRDREKDSRQDFRSTGPGTAVTFPLEVANLGHWMSGEDLTDTIDITCTGPDGWTVKGCGQALTLASGTAQRLDVSVTPPSNAVNVNGTFLVEARSRAAPGVVSQFKLIVFVEIRYGVGMWLDVEGGRKTVDPPIGVDPGRAYNYSIVIKNTGSAADKFDLKTESPAPGWTQALTLDGDAVDSVALDGGESKVLTFNVRAPSTETAPQNIVRVDAVSEANALAADGVNTATRIRPKINIALDVDPQTRVAEPNETAVFNLTVNNSGNDLFDIRFHQEGTLPKGWNATLGIPDITLNPGDHYTFPLYVTPPLGSLAGDLATVKVTAETDGDAGQTILGDEISAVVVVKKTHNVTLPALNDARATPGDTFEYVLPLTNHGNGNDIVELLPSAVTPAWRLTSKVDGLALDPGASDDFPIQVTVPNGTPPGPVNLTFTLRLTREAFQNLTIPLQVLSSARVVLQGAERGVAMTPGRAKELDLVARNVGNVPGAFDLNASTPPGWNVTFSPARVNLTPGDALPVVVLVNATRDAQDGAYALTLDALLSSAPAGSTPTSVTLARPALSLASVTASGSTAPGDLVLVTASVANKGFIAAENVSVELLVDGVAVDKVVLARVPVNDTKVATLNWLSTKRTSDLKVVLDRNGDIVELTRDAHEANVAFASKVPGPGIALLLGAIVLVAASLRRSSRGPVPPVAPVDERTTTTTTATGAAPRSGTQEGDR